MAGEKDRVTMIVRDAPSSMRAWNALRLAAALMSEDMDVRVFLIDDGVYCAVKEQQTPDGLRELNAGAKIEELIGFGVKVQCCSLCCETRGVAEDRMVAGVDIASTIDLARSIKESKHVLSM